MQPVIAIMIMGLGLGFLHAFDPDHLAAVSTFVSRRPGRKESARFALTWALGHSVSLLVLTVAVLFCGKAIGASAEKTLETMVGFVLIGLGLWRLVDFFWNRYQVHSHPHDGDAHEHFHVHRRGHDAKNHDHGHVVGFIGLLHGAAGSARFLILIPIALIGSLSGCLAYVGFFSVGVAAAMMLYAVCLGRLFEKSQGRFAVLQNIYQPLTGAVSLCIGLYWISTNL